MDVVRWLIFSLPTTVAYTFECFQMPGVALFLYRLIEPYNYLPSLHRQGLFFVSTDTKYCDVEKGKALIQRAAGMGYTPSIEWLSQYSALTQKSADQLKDIFEAIGIGKFAESRRRILAGGLVALLLLFLAVVLL